MLLRNHFYGSDGDGTTIQQAVWRPTGTQLGKKKLSTKEKSPAVAAKVIKKTSSSGGKNTKKRSRKVRARDVYVGDGAPAELFKRPAVELVYEPPPPLPPSAPQVNDDMQLVNDALRNNISNQTHFGNDLEIIEQPSQAQIYQQQPGLNVTQNWPLDLVQGSHHYQQVRQIVLSYLTLKIFASDKILSSARHYCRTLRPALKMR